MRRSLSITWIALAALCLGQVACGNDSNDTVVSQPEGTVDAAVFAFLSKARAAHHEADLAFAADRTADAIAAVRRITEGARPRLSPEVVEVLADAHSRLGELESQRGNFDVAAKEVDEGLKLATEITHFRGHLYEVRGLVEERRAKSLSAKGMKDESERAVERAIAAFQEAIEVQEQVIQRALPPAPKPSQ